MDERGGECRGEREKEQEQEQSQHSPAVASRRSVERVGWDGAPFLACLLLLLAWLGERLDRE